jgi:hypothetical protein
MSPQLRLLAALQEAEALAAEGREVAYALDCAARSHTVGRGEIAALWLIKVIARDRARAVIAAMQEADAEPGDTSSPSPYAHTVGHSKRGGR